MKQFHFEYWVKDNPECQRISIDAKTLWQAKQILIGRYAPVMFRVKFPNRSNDNAV